LSHREAQVGTEHILLGMIADAKERPGVFGRAIRLDHARETVSRVSGRRRRRPHPSEELPFTRNAQQVFEAAVMVRRRLSLTAAF
jgi:hypothetical protein